MRSHDHVDSGALMRGAGRAKIAASSMIGVDWKRRGDASDARELVIRRRTA